MRILLPVLANDDTKWCINSINKVINKLFKPVAQRPVHKWFLEITFVHNVCMRACVRACVCVCESAPEAIITSSIIGCDMEPFRLVKQVLGFSLSFIWQLKSWQIMGVAFVNKMCHENCM